jgi:hypothetical protein
MIGPGAKVVVRYADGKLIKGYTYDFAPGRRRFHIFASRDASSDPTSVLHSELKAVFLVREFAGNAQYNERKRFTDGRYPPGRRIEITFKDGEVLVGSTGTDLEPGPGVFVIPADPTSNNLRVFAVSAAIRRIRSLPADHATRLPVRAPRPKPALAKRLLGWLLEPIILPQPVLRRRASR